jgi:hypothetical protein
MYYYFGVYYYFLKYSIFRRCTEASLFGNEMANRWLHAMEIGWSYVAPALLTGLMDARVFLSRPPGFRRVSVLKHKFS